MVSFKEENVVCFFTVYFLFHKKFFSFVACWIFLLFNTVVVMQRLWTALHEIIFWCCWYLNFHVVSFFFLSLLFIFDVLETIWRVKLHFRITHAYNCDILKVNVLFLFPVASRPLHSLETNKYFKHSCYYPSLTLLTVIIFIFAILYYLFHHS